MFIFKYLIFNSRFQYFKNNLIIYNFNNQPAHYWFAIIKLIEFNKTFAIVLLLYSNWSIPPLNILFQIKDKLFDLF